MKYVFFPCWKKCLTQSINQSIQWSLVSQLEWLHCEMIQIYHHKSVHHEPQDSHQNPYIVIWNLRELNLHNNFIYAVDITMHEYTHASNQIRCWIRMCLHFHNMSTVLDSSGKYQCRRLFIYVNLMILHLTLFTLDLWHKSHWHMRIKCHEGSFLPPDWPSLWRIQQWNHSKLMQYFLCMWD